MNSVRGQSTVVLIVEDERDLADLYAEWLHEEYEVRTSYDAESAMEQLDEAVDVVLLDRRLPGMSGDEFLERVEAGGFDCRVAMVSAVDPDFDIIEMGFDDYLTKPVEREDLHAIVERLTSIDAAGHDAQGYFALLAKKETLEAEKSQDELRRHQEYADLLASIDAYERHVLSLANTYLSEAVQGSVREEKLQWYDSNIGKWQERQRGLQPSDPLYCVAEAEIRRYEQLREITPDVSNAEAEFLEHVAEGFVAEGFWLDSRVRRALNRALFEKSNDELIVNRKRVEPGSISSPEEQFEVSQIIRQRAKDQLSE